MGRGRRILIVMIALVGLVSLASPSGAETADRLTAEALTQEAETIVTALLEAYPGDVETHALMGRMRYLQGAMQEAEASWRRALELAPERGDIYEALARSAWDQGEFNETVAACQSALKINPTMAGVRVRLGRSLLELGKIEAAVAELERAVSSSGRGHYYLAQAYMQSSNYEKARDSYLRAVENRPNNAQAYYGLAMASLRLDQPEAAERYQQRFREIGVEDPEAVKAQKRGATRLSGLSRERSATAITAADAAKIYRRHGEAQKAELLLQRAATVDPSHFSSRDELLKLYDKTGRLEEARSFFEQLTQLHPTSVRDHFHLGTLSARLNRRDDAERAFLAVTRHADDPSIGSSALARLYLRGGWKLPEAREAASTAVQHRPSPQNYFLLAQAHAKLGSRAEALAALERGLKLDPNHAPCLRLYNELREAG